MFEEFGINAGYVEELHHRWLESPAAVDEKWRRFFDEGVMPEGVPATAAPAPTAAPVAAVAPAAAPVPEPPATAFTAPAPPLYTATPAHAPTSAPELPGDTLDAERSGGRVYELINAYRVRGHRYAHLDPLSDGPPAAPELELAAFGLGEDLLDHPFPTINLRGLGPRATLRQIVAHLRETYCGSIGVEYTHIESPEERVWLRERMESTKNRITLDKKVALRTVTKLTDAEIFEQFLAKNFVGQKRFSAEGAESVIALLDEIVESAGAHGVREAIFGMAHRGRLNVLVNVLGKRVREIFAAFDDKHPDRFLGGGDVKYHLGYSNDVVTSSGAPVHLTMCFNPSHLEWVNPVVLGRARAKQDRAEPGRRGLVMPILVHGDAAFMGQGIVAESLNLAGLAGYTTGGTVHVVVNNQIGFTTNPEDSRSTRYCTDVTRMMKVPVLHVNGEDPEAVVCVARLAVEFRQRFGKDVVIDMYCYRKYGHNEGDEPRFTQPLMYKRIDSKPSVREVYVRRLAEAGVVTHEEAAEIVLRRRAALDSALAEARTGDYFKPPETMGGIWARYRGGGDADVPEVETGVPEERLVALAEELARVPDGFTAHPKVLKVLSDRRDGARAGHPLDWGAGEHLAFASLLAEGVPVRLTGQDARRGTFTHRHATVFDTETGAAHTPLEALASRKARFDVYDSPLSEAGVLGFEYGFSLDRPDALVLWEAQFGDFLNTAQVIVDQFISTAEDKWLRLSGLVLLLPHGFEGQGPEHSSARLERFLQLCAEDNLQVTNPTTPAQFFHLLRRQAHRPLRKPLVVLTPKSLLRHKEATSPLAEFAHGTFRRVIPDASVDPGHASRVLLCTGKVYYDLVDRRRKTKRDDVAIVRLEQLYPVGRALADALAPYPSGTPLVWVQEEPRNMGAWYFLNAHLRDWVGDRLPLSLVSRDESASPATGSPASHALEQRMLLDAAFR